MKKEDTEKAAIKHIENVLDSIIDYTVINNEEDNYEAGRRDALFDFGSDIFKAGADWRINSVWHDVEESPKQGSLIAVFDGKDMYLWRAEDIVNVINGRIRVISITVKECFIRQHIIKWAYIKDLIPTED